MRSACVGVLFLALFGLSFLFGFPSAAAAETLEEAVLAELNFARAQPRAYARKLRRQARHDPPHPDDPYALEEAIEFLHGQGPLPPLEHDAGLAAAARDHAAAQGRRGGFGHVGPRGETLKERLRRRGVWAGMSAENISYGQETAARVVQQLIVDGGVPQRGHRKNVFGGFQVAGVACGPHRAYGAMCVIDFAAALVRR